MKKAFSCRTGKKQHTVFLFLDRSTEEQKKIRLSIWDKMPHSFIKPKGQSSQATQHFKTALLPEGSCHIVTEGRECRLINIQSWNSIFLPIPASFDRKSNDFIDFLAGIGKKYHSNIDKDIASLLTHRLPKPRVAGSSPYPRKTSLFAEDFRRIEMVITGRLTNTLKFT